MYVCMYVYTSLCTTMIYEFMCEHTFVCVSIYVFKCMYMYVCIDIHKQIYTNMHTYVAYIYIHRYIHIHTVTYTAYIHTNILTAI